MQAVAIKNAKGQFYCTYSEGGDYWGPLGPMTRLWEPTPLNASALTIAEQSRKLGDECEIVTINVAMAEALPGRDEVPTGDAKLEVLIAALNQINHIIFDKGVCGLLDATTYFKIRELCTSTIRAVGGKVA